jgi:hypothetical protein
MEIVERALYYISVATHELGTELHATEMTGRGDGLLEARDVLDKMIKDLQYEPT